MLSLVAAAVLSSSVLHARTIEWAGVQWQVKSGRGGPGPNLWSDSDDSVWVDDDGRLHLALRRVGTRWLAAEVHSLDCTGYGTHRFYFDAALDELDPNVIAAAFLYADDSHEIDIEFARWGDAFSPTNAQYVVQPPTPWTYTTFAMALSGTYTTHSIDWQAGQVRFRSLHGHHVRPPGPGYTIASDRMAGAAVPEEADDLRVHINLWLMGGAAPTDGREVEIVVTDADLPTLTACGD